jgi:predicted nucleotidyltransferase
MQYKCSRIKASVERLIDDIALQSLPVKCVILFGSTITGRYNELSDIDLCVVHDQEGEYYDADANFSSRCLIENYVRSTVDEDVDVDFIHCTPHRLLNGSDVFSSIRKEGVVMYGGL